MNSLGSLNLQGCQSNVKKGAPQTLNLFPMIENFAVFGVSEENIHNNSNKSINEILDGELLYSFK
jgi:hypothetical protein